MRPYCGQKPGFPLWGPEKLEAYSEELEYGFSCAAPEAEDLGMGKSEMPVTRAR